MSSAAVLLLFTLVQAQSGCVEVSGDRCTVCNFAQAPTACDNLTIADSTPNGRVICKGGLCQGSQFICNGDCTIECIDQNTCKDISAECAAGKRCSLHCSGSAACSGTVTGAFTTACKPDDACSPELQKLMPDDSESNSVLIIVLVALSCLLLVCACLAFYLCKKKSPPAPPPPPMEKPFDPPMLKMLPEEPADPVVPPPPVKTFVTVPKDEKEVKAAVDWHPSCEWNENYRLGCGKSAQVITEDTDDATLLLRFTDINSEAWYPMALFNDQDYRGQFPGSPWMSNSIGRGYSYRIQKSLRENGGTYPYSRGYTLGDKPDAPWV